MRPLLPAGLILALLLMAGTADAAPVNEELATATASQLRCVVCQNLSVADSPSEMARQMRDVIRERLSQGETPQQVIAYFVDRYGEWVLLAPPPRGFNLVLWLLPFAGLVGGLGLVLRVAHRWARHAVETSPGAEATPTPVDRERIRVELERLPE